MTHRSRSLVALCCESRQRLRASFVTMSLPQIPYVVCRIGTEFIRGAPWNHS